MSEERVKPQGIEDKISRVESLLREVVLDRYTIDTHPHKPWITLTLKDTGTKAIVLYPMVDVIAVYDKDSTFLANEISDQYRQSIGDISIRGRFGKEANQEH
ncbi:hypothetical protein AUJ84_02155 [Candidatus Pacearchaeota archaeon CG1_02_32_132]|nr:MAG: hypothetical protein AUJ84_02155 [Candidatus Pacearchaeota archaeon CG1_02_32_132]